MRRALSIAASALLVACGEDPDPPRPVDETGYMTQSLLYYSADQPLGSAPVDVAVVGVAGAVRRTDGSLEIRKSSDGSSTAVTVNNDGSFAAVVNAMVSETLALTYSVGGDSETLTVVLSDRLDQLGAPQVGTGSTPFVQANASTGMVEVALGELANPDPPYIVVNVTRGIPIWAQTIMLVSISGGSGDRVCVFKIDQTAGTQSPTVCHVVP